MKKKDLADLERMGERSAENLVAQIENSKKRELSRLVFGLGIRHVGVNAARILAGHFKNMGALAVAAPEELQKINTIGEVMAQSVWAFFQKKQNLKIIENLEVLGVNMREPEKHGVSKALEGQAFVLTGTLKNFSRDEAGRAILDRGGHVSTSVSKKTTAVVVGEAPGSKLLEAKKLGIRTMNEEEFRKFLSLKP